MTVNFKKDNTYQLEFLPVRYKHSISGGSDYHHFVFDRPRKLTPAQLLLRARVNDGKGIWEFAEYYRALSATKDSPLTSKNLMQAVIEKAKEHTKQVNEDWRIYAISKTHKTLQPPQLPMSRFQGGKRIDSRSRLTDTYFDKQTQTLYFGSKYLDKSVPKSKYYNNFLDALYSKGPSLSSVTSITFKRILPMLAIGLSFSDVAKAEDKVDKALEETTKHSGGFTGAGIGAAAGLPAGPVGALIGGLAGGIAGWEGSSWLYEKNKQFWSWIKAPTAAPTLKLSPSQPKVSLISEVEERIFAELNQRITAEQKPYSVMWYPEIAQKLGLSSQPPEYMTAHHTEQPDIIIEELTEPALKVFRAKSETEFRQAFEEFSKVDKEDLSESDQIVLSYLKDNFSYHYSSSKSFTDLKSATLEQIYLVDNVGRASVELGKLAFALKNRELGTALTIGGNIYMGMSSMMLFMKTTGAVAVGHFVGVLGAISSIISLFSNDDALDQIMQTLVHNFREVFRQLEQMHRFMGSVMDAVLSFRKDLFEYLNIYLGALMLRSYYHEEIMRHGFSQMRYEFTVTRDLTEEILKQLDDEVIYKARDFYENARDIESLSRSDIEDLLTALYLRLDKSSANYKSGVAVCRAQFAHNSFVAMQDIMAMIESPAKHGQLPGYLACYYKVNKISHHLNMSAYPSHVINPHVWSELVKFYLHARRAPKASDYDLNLVRLAKINQQGLDYIEFIRAQREHLVPILTPIFHHLAVLLHNMSESLAYPKEAHDFLRLNHTAPANIRLMFETMQSASINMTGVTLTNIGFKAVGGLAQVTNEFLALVNVGVGEFIVRHEGCPINQTFPFYEEYEHKTMTHRSNKLRTIKYKEDRLFGIDSSSFHYMNSVIYRHFINGNDTRLVLTGLNQSLRYKKISMCYLEGSRQTNATAFGHHLFLQQRRNFSETQASLLEKLLPFYREKIMEQLLHVKLILKTVGLYESVVQAFPILHFPSELTPWMNIYRADMHHTDLYRPWPTPVEIIDTMNNFSNDVLNFKEFLFEFVSGDTKKIAFNYSNDHLVIEALLNIDQFQLNFLENNDTRLNDDEEHFSEPDAVPLEKTSSAISGDTTKMITMLETIIQQNQVLKEQNIVLERRLENLERRAGFFAEAVSLYDLDNIMSWPYQFVKGVSDERTYYNPNNQYHYVHVRRLINKWEDISSKNLECQHSEFIKHCFGDDIEYVEHFPSVFTLHQPAWQIFFHIAMRSAFLSAIPEALGDILGISKCVSKKRAEKLKWWASLSLLFCLSGYGSIWLLALNVMVAKIFQLMGMSENYVRIAGHAIGFFFGGGDNVSFSTRIAMTGVHYFSGNLALFAEKKIIRKIAPGYLAHGNAS